MKIDRVDLYSSSTKTEETLVASVPFKDRNMNNPYVIKAIYGLDADEIVAQPRGLAYRMFLQKRSVAIRFALNPRNTNGETFSSLRDRLYKAVSLSMTGYIYLVLMDGETIVAETHGHISKIEAPHFEQAPLMQVTIECVDPLLLAPEDVELDPPDFTMATHPTMSTLTIEDDISTAPHGAEIWFDVEDDIGATFSFGSLMLMASGTWFDREDFEFEDGDKLRLLISPFGSRASLAPHEPIEVYYEGINMWVTPNSTFPLIYPGVNEFQVSGGVNVTKVVYRPAFWGV